MTERVVFLFVLELQMSQRLFFCTEAWRLQASWPPASSIQRLQFCVHKLHPELRTELRATRQSFTQYFLSFLSPSVQLSYQLSLSCKGVTRTFFFSSLSCLHFGASNLNLMHESSSLIFCILAHSCCDLEVHIEELNRVSTWAAQYKWLLSPVVPCHYPQSRLPDARAWGPDILGTAQLCTFKYRRLLSVSSHLNAAVIDIFRF